MTKRTYASVRAEIEKLEELAEELRQQEVAQVIADTRATIAAYNLSAKDLFGSTRKRAAISPKYQDPASGVTWSGMGRAPEWIRDVPKNKREKFLIA